MCQISDICHAFQFKIEYLAHIIHSQGQVKGHDPKVMETGLCCFGCYSFVPKGNIIGTFLYSEMHYLSALCTEKELTTECNFFKVSLQ